MWCDQCRQDVPGIASSESDGGFLCAKCNNVLNASFAKPSYKYTATENQEADIKKTLPFQFDTWKLQDDIDRVDRILDSLGMPEQEEPAAPATSMSSPQETARTVHSKEQTPKKQRPTGRPRGSFISWLALSLGCMALVCGLVLLTWSLVGARAELWNVGLPLTIIGQAGLLIGLVFQLDGVWQNNRKTQGYLEELEDELQQLHHTTKLMNTTQGQSSQSFYMHMAEGASPHLLLSDLKGQLDLLAVQMAQDQQKR
ncbi:MAG: hypothetical protein ACKVH8_23625 [Pirellulales bacterium]